MWRGCGAAANTLRAAALLAPVLLAACASVAEPRLRSALSDAGLGRQDAACMARRMVDRLSLAQIRQLGRLAEEGRSARTLPEFVTAVGRRADAETLAVTASSALVCAAQNAR